MIMLVTALGLAGGLQRKPDACVRLKSGTIRQVGLVKKGAATLSRIAGLGWQPRYYLMGNSECSYLRAAPFTFTTQRKVQRELSDTRIAISSLRLLLLQNRPP